MTEPILRVTDLVKHYPVKSGVLQRQAGTVNAVNGVSFELFPGETVGLVGESGCGKTTVGRSIMRFIEPTSGTITFQGRDLGLLARKEMRLVRRDIQYVFQDPYGSLPSHLPIGAILAEPLEIHRIGTRDSRRRKVMELLELVGLPVESALRYPHEFSGGQRQRVGIARALILEPKVLILDEPVSALDVSIQAQVVNLLRRLQRELGLAYLFIAHDLAVVRHIANRIAVMYLGKIMEYGVADNIFSSPSHPYTQALLASIPVPDPRLASRQRAYRARGEIPNPIHLPSGCPFRTRCWKAVEICAEETPPLTSRTPSGQLSACHFAEEEPPLVAIRHGFADE